MRDHKGQPIDSFNGLFNRGDFENTPKDHFQGSNNIKHQGKSVMTRDGINISQSITAVTPLTNVRRFYNYPTVSANTLIVLVYDPATNTGKIYHVVSSTVVFGPILSIVGMTDFAFLPFGGRAYISPFALQSPALAPPTGIAVTLKTGAGIEVGVHQYAVTFVTAVGETTASPTTSVTHNAGIANPTTTPLVTAGPNTPSGNNLVAGANYRWRFTYSIDNNQSETNVGAVSAIFSPATNLVQVFVQTDTPFPATVNLKINLYRTQANGAVYFREYELLSPGDIPVTGVPSFLIAGILDDTTLATKPQAPAANGTQVQQSTLTIPIGDNTVTKRRIWRTVAGGTQLKLLQTINDNVTTGPLNDAAADGTLGVNVPTSDTALIAGGSPTQIGLNGEFLYVYDGDGTNARKAAGIGLTGTLSIASGAAGHTDAGNHVFGFVSESKSGYLAPPGALKVFNTLATNSVSFGNVPVGNSTVVKRHLVASKKITGSVSTNLSSYDLFFVPNATINNNTDLFLNNISFFDADLLDDASHLIDNFTSIPAGSFLTLYRGRLVLGCVYTDINLVLVSAEGEPEAISQVSGLLATQPNGFPVSNAAEFRDTLYVFRPNSTMSFTDNGDDPSSWKLVEIDAALGTQCHGISQFLNSSTQNIDFLIIATYQGISLFTGTYQTPELSWDIESLWRSLDRTNFGRIQIANNIVKKRIYIILPDRSLLVGFFQGGLDPKLIQWEQWTFAQPVNTIAVTTIDTDIIGSDIY